jgi:hypothetical protein
MKNYLASFTAIMPAGHIRYKTFRTFDGVTKADGYGWALRGPGIDTTLDGIQLPMIQMGNGVFVEC